MVLFIKENLFKLFLFEGSSGCWTSGAQPYFAHVCLWLSFSIKDKHGMKSHFSLKVSGLVIYIFFFLKIPLTELSPSKTCYRNLDWFAWAASLKWQFKELQFLASLLRFNFWFARVATPGVSQYFSAARRRALWMAVLNSQQSHYLFGPD